MGGRHLPRLTAALAAALCAACRAPARPLAPGDAVALAPASGDELVWVVPASEFRVCGPLASDVRDAQWAPGAPPLVVVFVGPHPEWMRDYLRTQRVRARLVALGNGEFARSWGVAPVHALYRVAHGRVTEALSMRNGGSEARFRAVLAGHGAGSAAAAGAADGG